MPRTGELFDRRARLTIASPSSDPANFSGESTFDVVQIEGGRLDDNGHAGMRIAFKIVKSLEKNPNTSEITVSNLNQDRRASLQKKGQKVRLEAGYREIGMAQLFAGDVRTIDHERKDGSWNTVIKPGDGERAWQFARVSESFAPGTAVADALKRIAQKTGLDLGNLNTKAAEIDKILDSGWVAAGNAMKALNQLAGSIGLGVSIQDGKLQFLFEDDALDQSLPEISPSSGLIESPEMGTPPTKGKPQLLKFKSLLTPVKPGAKVVLKSERYPNATIKIVKVTHEGDTHGGKWYSEMEGVILK